MANTPNIDLVKPAGTDHALVSVLNSNSDKIDTFAGTTNQAITNVDNKVSNYTASQWVGNVTSIDAVNALTTPGRYLRYLNIANAGIPSGWAVIDVSALSGYDNYIQVVTFPTTGASYTRQHPTNSTWGEFVSLIEITKRYGLLTTGNTPASQTAYTLTDSITNYKRAEIIFTKSGTSGAFVSRIIDKDNYNVGTAETMSFSAYNNSSYNLYAECGFPTATSFRISTYNCTGWTMGKVYVVGIEKA